MPKNPKELQTLLKKLPQGIKISPSIKKQILQNPAFAFLIPTNLLKKIKIFSFKDPIVKQFIPHILEEKKQKDFFLDPTQDQQCKKGKILQKYQGRALLLTSSSCCMHCRYCFRKNFPYEKPKQYDQYDPHNPQQKNTQVNLFKKELLLLQKDPSISELILSGGDPLSLSNFTLQNLFSSLEKIPHIKRIRIHTRYIIGDPKRIDSSFLSILKNSTKKLFFVFQVNHPQELDDEIFDALKKIQLCNIPILTQTVLLKNINDSKNVLKALFETLINHGILPYYLHQLDKVQGSSHFEVSEKKGLSLINSLKKELPGYAVPKYVKEEAKKPSKTWITCDSLS
jgi:EF-P beta-lysylation protein EpmB